MFERLAAIEEKYEELGQLMYQPDVVTNPDLLRKYGQEHAGLEETVQAYREY